MDDFKLQKDEVSGIVKTDLESFYRFSFDEAKDLPIKGFRKDEHGRKLIINERADRSQMVPHEYSYFEKIAAKIKEEVEKHS